MTMKWERRKNTNAPQLQPTALPVDYLRLVEQTLTQALEPGLNELKKTLPVSEFTAQGGIFGDEVVLAITLSHGAEHLAATTLYASADFNPNAEKPSLEATLSACLDAAGSIFDFYLDVENPERIEQLAHHTLGALEEAPFEWTAMPESPALKDSTEKRVPVWVKIDKSNLPLETMAEKWLMENDPDYPSKEEETDHHEAEDFLNERLDAIKKAGSGNGNSGGMGGGSGPITH